MKTHLFLRLEVERVLDEMNRLVYEEDEVSAKKYQALSQELDKAQSECLDKAVKAAKSLKPYGVQF